VQYQLNLNMTSFTFGTFSLVLYASAVLRGGVQCESDRNLRGLTDSRQLKNGHVEYVQRGCTEYNAGSRFDTRPPNTPMQAGNAKTCSEACSKKNYPFFGFECPMKANNDVHCQCYAGERIGNKPIEEVNCKALVGSGGDKHCTGEAMVDGISMGGADIGSIYEVSDFMQTASNGYDEILGRCEGATCSLFGDPHILTCDGLAYDCQGTGLFTIMKNHLYNVQGNFVPVGLVEAQMVLNWGHFPEASYTNDIMIETLTDNNKMQFSFLDVSNHDGSFPSEKGCIVNEYYIPLNPIAPRSVESSLEACRNRCEQIDLCTHFSYWGDGGCHMNDGNSELVPTPPNWSRSLAGPLSECGKPDMKDLEQKETTEELDKAITFGNGCPFLFYLDGEIQDISEVEYNDYIFGDAKSEHSAKLEGHNKVRVSHKTESGAISEALLEVAGEGPGELWGCHWNFFVCLPSAEQERFEEFSVGLFGSPDGNTQNDWTDITGQSVVIPYEQRGQGAFDYCHENWCVSQEDSIMVFPTGTTYEDHKCVDEEYVDFNIDNEICVLSADKINKKCSDKPHLLINACQIECCYGGCDTFDSVENEIVSITTLSTFDEDIVYNDFVPTPICNETYKQSTSETACPSSKSIVELVQTSAEIPEQEPILYGIVIEPPAKDENIGQTVKFSVANPFKDYADVYVRYMKKVGVYAMDQTCYNMPNTVAGCDQKAPVIEVGCHEYPGIGAFALIDIYFASNKDSFIIDNTMVNTVDKCCKPPSSYKEDGYGVIKYTFKIQCSCPEDTYTKRI